MADTVIEVRDLTRIYRLGDIELRALDGVSLRIKRGEFIAIMGSSGSGKSTLMNVLGCLDRPTSGRYTFEGVDIAGLSEAELARIRSERIGFVFQNFNLLARTSAIENVALPLFYATSGPARRSQRLARAQRVLQLLGLEERTQNSPNQLSGGQQQSVAIARTLINEPSLLLADEPTGNLDSRTSHEIMATLRSLNREQGVTIVVVTHESDIAAYADRKVTMRDGHILSDQRNRAMLSEQIREVTADIAFHREETDGAASAPGQFWAFALMVMTAAAQAIGRNKLRSALTVLGVFIGVAALIAMVAVGEGAHEAVKKQIESLGRRIRLGSPLSLNRPRTRSSAKAWRG
jgi:macrolide transport system ATP-binding/permease protein